MPVCRPLALKADGQTESVALRYVCSPRGDLDERINTARRRSWGMNASTQTEIEDSRAARAKKICRQRNSCRGRRARISTLIAQLENESLLSLQFLQREEGLQCRLQRSVCRLVSEVDISQEAGN
jgi:hypothetical protein